MVVGSGWWVVGFEIRKGLRRIPSRGFDFAAVPFAFDAAPLGSPAGLGAFAALRLVDGFQQQSTEAGEDFFAVEGLAAFGVGGDVNLAGGGPAAAGEGAEALAGGIVEAFDGGGGDPELGLGVDLVDVLPTGAAAAGVLEADGRLGSKDAGGELDLWARGWRRGC